MMNNYILIYLSIGFSMLSYAGANDFNQSVTSAQVVALQKSSEKRQADEKAKIARNIAFSDKLRSATNGTGGTLQERADCNNAFRDMNIQGAMQGATGNAYYSGMIDKATYQYNMAETRRQIKVNAAYIIQSCSKVCIQLAHSLPCSD